MADSEEGRAYPKVRALHDYTARTPNELSFKKGDLITVYDFVDDTWYSQGQRGATAKRRCGEDRELSAAAMLQRTRGKEGGGEGTQGCAFVLVFVSLLCCPFFLSFCGLSLPPARSALPDMCDCIPPPPH